MIRVYLIRHGFTEGNLKKRYIGWTDEPLCEAGIRELKCRTYPRAERIFVSPMLRCRQSAALIYPDKPYEVVEAFKECHFGRFENKNYEELSEDKAYKQWIDSMGTLPFPEGERIEAFKKRTLHGFYKVLLQCQKDGIKTAALVIHGGSIMTLMEHYAFPQGNYYDYQIRNGEGYELLVMEAGDGLCRNDTRLDIGRPDMAVSSGASYRTPHQWERKNYQKLFAEDESL